MKIAVACDRGEVTQHFGHCESFNVFEVDDNEVVNREILQNPGHKPGFLPKFLHEKGVNVIISGGMGGAAVDIFNENDIEVIIGARGSAEDNVHAYLKGELRSTGSVCHGH